MQHLDENGQPCTRHAAISEPRLYELATLGSRIAGFHHDAASKLQSLVMAVDEISELAADAEPEERAAIDTAHAALRDLQALFAANRALAKAPQRARITLGELVQRAAERTGVKVRGELPACDLRVTAPALTHGVALLLDLAAGPGHLGRVVDVSAEIGGHDVTLVLVGPKGAAAKPPVNTAEVVAIATYIITRDDGELRCGGEGEKFIARLPIAQPTVAMPPVAKP